MMQFLSRLTARLRSRRATVPSQRRARRTALSVEALEDRLAPSSVTSMGWDVHSAGAGQESQISYWSWGEREIPVEQLFGSTR
jgi:hypothetical protein